MAWTRVRTWLSKHGRCPLTWTRARPRVRDRGKIEENNRVARGEMDETRQKRKAILGDARRPGRRFTLLSKLEDGLLFFAERIASKIRKGALHPTLTTTLATPQDFTRRRGTLYPASKIEASILQPIIPTAGMGPRMCTKQHKASLRQVSAVGQWEMIALGRVNGPDEVVYVDVNELGGQNANLKENIGNFADSLGLRIDHLGGTFSE
ncbi:hypothetical protein GE21DRAFT_1274960 [Neurospora crassa]|nr:hypothetical protein GE21DRAFT_1274960 [Neurospora crassa]